MSEPQTPVRRPLLALAVIVLLFGALIGSVLIWQQARWMFATPLAVVFQDHDPDREGVDVRHAEIRKFISLDVSAADELAKSAGFDCKALKFTKSLALCYRDVWTRLCKDIWSLGLVIDNKKKISRADGRKRRVCLFQW